MTGPILKNLLDLQMQFGPLTSGFDDEPTWKHWKLAHDKNQVAWLYFDQQNSSINVLSEAVLNEFGEVLEHLGKQELQGLVLRSAKLSGFCVGANIEEFRGLENEEEIIRKLEKAHSFADELAGFSCPTVAIIHGPCLGGGLELALCCDYRLALPNAKMGLPEVRLGLHPGLGGTARLTHLIDPIEAMTLMLTGRTLDARRAQKSGLVDAVIEERHILNAVQAAVNQKLKQHSAGLKDRMLTMRLARQMEARQMRSKSDDKAPPQHYPSPGSLIDLWEEYGGNEQEMRQAEIRSFAKLLTTSTAQNLIRVFFLREQMKRTTRSDKQPLQHVHVIGAGAMGGDIAGWCAFSGLRVSLYDTEIDMIAQAVSRANTLCRTKHLTAADTRDVLDRLIPDPDNRGLGRADLVIEAVPEKLEVKHKVYQQVEPLLKQDAVLATNTSSIPLHELASGLKDPGRFIGLHFFNPVSKMQLVEVVDQEGASEKTRKTAMSFVGRIDRLPALVASAPGFLVNRILMPYLLEAIILLDEGVPAVVIDHTAETFGMPMGPVELADHVGLDICLDVADMLQARLDKPMAQLPQWFRDQVKNGGLGRKSGKGFYTWKDGDPVKKAVETTGEDGELLNRLLLPMLNTCMTCLREGIIDSEELLDGAVIFGTGFAPFLGGPMQYARSRGFNNIARELNVLAEKHGERFSPDPGWEEGL